MKVFISWSGERSRRIANEIHKWLPSVIQAIRPYFSPDDVAKGTRWAGEIAAELQASRVGLLVLTADNIEASWLVFEAGALSKSLESSRVCPLLFDIEPTDIKGPLVQFQGAKFDQSEMKRVVKMMNSELGDAALAPDVFDNVFSKWWPELSEKISKILQETKVAKKEDTRTDRDILQEILTLSRATSRSAAPNDFPHPRAIEDLLTYFEQLRDVSDTIHNGELTEVIDRLSRPVAYFESESALPSRSPRSITFHTTKKKKTDVPPT